MNIRQIREDNDIKGAKLRFILFVIGIILWVVLAKTFTNPYEIQEFAEAPPQQLKLESLNKLPKSDQKVVQNILSRFNDQDYKEYASRKNHHEYVENNRYEWAYRTYIIGYFGAYFLLAIFLSIFYGIVQEPDSGKRKTSIILVLVTTTVLIGCLRWIGVLECFQ